MRREPRKTLSWRPIARWVLAAAWLAATGCVPLPPPLEGAEHDATRPPDDASTDAGADAGADATLDPDVDSGTRFDAGLVVDAGSDSGFDAGADAGFDAGFDAGHDAGFDAGRDAGHDSGFDAGFDAGHDAGFDAGPIRLDAGVPPSECALGSWECGGSSPFPQQPLVPGTTCCCNWGLAPYSDHACR